MARSKAFCLHTPHEGSEWHAKGMGLPLLPSTAAWKCQAAMKAVGTLSSAVPHEEGLWTQGKASPLPSTTTRSSGWHQRQRAPCAQQSLAREDCRADTRQDLPPLLLGSSRWCQRRWVLCTKWLPTTEDCREQGKATPLPLTTSQNLQVSSIKGRQCLASSCSL